MNASCARSHPAEGTSAWVSRNRRLQPLRPVVGGAGADVGLPCAARTRLAQKQSPRRRSPRLSVVGRPSDTAVGERLPNGTPRPPSVPNGMLRPRPQVRRDYPLSLSISISGGKETYKDSLSNGERTGNSPALESGGSVVRIVVWRSVLSGGPGPSPLEGGAREGESPVVPGPCRTTRRCLRVGLFGNAAQIGR